MSAHHNLIPAIENLHTAVVACVGDLMLDHFVYGSVSRISPEAPIPVLRIESQQSMLGGLGNVVRNLGALGCGVRVFSVTGDDEPGTEIDALLRAVPRCDAHIAREGGRKTAVKLRYVANGQQLLRADSETTQPVSRSSLEAVLSVFSQAIAGCSIVVLSDYAKGMIAGNFASEFIDAAKSQGKAVLVDPKGRDYRRYRNATLIKPNLKELGEAVELPVSNTSEQVAAAHKLIEQTDAKYILVTRGSAGMLLVSHQGDYLETPALAREVFEVSGAGDTVASALAAALGSNSGIADAVNIANIAAGIVVGKSGTAVVEPWEIIHEIEHHSALAASGKILRPDQALERVSRWRRMKCRIGLITGTFEDFSAVHVQALEKARTECDRLVVALRSDASSNSSGPAYMVASTVFADAVVIGKSESEAELIASLHPDILFG